MKRAIAGLAAVALLVISPAGEAGRGRGGVAVAGGGAHFGHPAGVRFAHPHFHGGTRVFIGGAFVAWPGWYYGAPYYPAPPPVSYWYYCAAAGGYYPYVPYCPGGWQLVPAYPGY